MAKFHERFGIDLEVTEGKRRFVNRTLNFLLNDMVKIAVRRNDLSGRHEVEQYICSKLGERFDGIGCLERVMRNDFDYCLRALEALHEHHEWEAIMETTIQNILTETEVDIGIRWGNGEFLPAGVPDLDVALVSDPLGLLGTSEYKGVSDAFKKGLDHFLHSTKSQGLLADVLTDMHEALEALAKIVCQNEKEFSANREAFISNVGLTEPYKRMLKDYIDYANKFGRHAGPQGMPKPMPSRKEVEAFMYLTGLFIRVTVSKDS